MDQKTLWMIVLGGGLAVAAYAGLRSGTPPEPAAADRGAPSAGSAPELPPGHPTLSPSASLPAGHPPLSATPPGLGPPGAEASLAWKTPDRWKESPNPSTMRIATYKIPHAPSDTEDAEMSVTRAGGAASANVDRWLGQFDDAARAKAKTSERTIAGFKTTVVEVEGTFAGGGMMGAPSGPKSGWALIGAIVETPGGVSHFFKLTGPSATVKAAKPEVDALLGSIKQK